MTSTGENMENSGAAAGERGTVLLALGGIYHDFEGYAAVMTPVLEARGYRVVTTYTLADFHELDKNQIDVVLMYTCSGSKEEMPAADSAALDALVEWVAAGGRFLAAHAATVSGIRHTRFAQMAGGYFVQHPPQFAFQVTPLGRTHPLIADLDAFTVFDEFYIQSFAADVEIHLVATDRGVTYPMAWTRRHGGGSVANVALGHSVRVWTLPAYQQLMGQTVDWLVSPDAAAGSATLAG